MTSEIKFKAGIVHNNQNLIELEPVLKRWTKSVQEYNRTVKDICWMYKERANVSILAGAAWQEKGWTAMEEYGTVKKKENGDRSNGRCDLYISNEELDFAIEAKLARVSMKGDGERTKKFINRAWEDARKLKRGEASFRVAATFIVPRITEAALKKSSMDVEGEFLEWIERLKSIKNLHSLAYVYALDNEHTIRAQNGKISPGVALVLREMQRGN